MIKMVARSDRQPVFGPCADESSVGRGQVVWIASKEIDSDGDVWAFEDELRVWSVGYVRLTDLLDPDEETTIPQPGPELPGTPTDADVLKMMRALAENFEQGYQFGKLESAARNLLDVARNYA